MQSIDEPGFSAKKLGMTLIELIVCTVIIGILSATALPLSHRFVQGEKEDVLKSRLRDLREGLDRYHERVRKASPEKNETDCWPRTLETLVDERVLRRLPVDPMTGRVDWVTRSSTDPASSSYSDRFNVFDVRSSATGTAFDGSRYDAW
ncbi:MAG: type II secretion system protein [Candidatus Ozemobacteraceae bacterium]